MKYSIFSHHHQFRAPFHQRWFFPITKTRHFWIPNEIAVIGTGTIPGILKAANSVPSILWGWSLPQFRIFPHMYAECAGESSNKRLYRYPYFPQLQVSLLRYFVLWSLATYLAWYPGHSLFHLYSVSNIILDSSISPCSFFQLLHNIFWHSLSRCLKLRIAISSWRIILFIIMEYPSLFIPNNFPLL